MAGDGHNNGSSLHRGATVNAGGGGSWLDRIIGSCVGLLIAATAIYCAVKVIEAVLPALIVITGVMALIGLVVGAIVVFRTWFQRW